MGKLLVKFGFLAAPLLAQGNTLLPIKPLVSNLTAPAFKEKFVEAAPPSARTFYRWSIAGVLGANLADVASSWHAQEANRVVAGGGAQFGTASLAIKSGLVATSLLIQHVTLRHRPDLYRKLAWMNFGTAGVLGGVAGYNMRVK